MQHARKTLSLTRSDFGARVLHSAVPVLLHFRAGWCSPCQTVTRVLDELADELAGRVAVGEVDVDASPELVETYAVANVPTLLLFANGRVRAQLRGRVSRAQIASALGTLPQFPASS